MSSNEAQARLHKCTDTSETFLLDMQNLDVDKVTSQNINLSPHWIHQHGRLKEVFTHIIEPRYEISINVVYPTNKASDQPAHKRSLIRAFASRLNIL